MEQRMKPIQVSAPVELLVKREKEKIIIIIN